MQEGLPTSFQFILNNPGPDEDGYESDLHTDVAKVTWLAKLE